MMIWELKPKWAQRTTTIGDLPGRIRILCFAADVGTKLGILLTALLAFSVVPWLLPNGKIIFLCKFLPAKVTSCLFNSILFFFQILLSPFPTPVMGFPVDGWARKDPESTRPQHTVHLGQVNTICINAKMMILLNR